MRILGCALGPLVGDRETLIPLATPLRQMMRGLCYICSEAAVGSCPLCGRLVCQRHILSPEGLCSNCVTGKRA